MHCSWSQPTSTMSLEACWFICIFDSSVSIAGQGMCNSPREKLLPPFKRHSSTVLGPLLWPDCNHFLDPLLATPPNSRSRHWKKQLIHCCFHAHSTFWALSAAQILLENGISFRQWLLLVYTPLKQWLCPSCGSAWFFNRIMQPTLLSITSPVLMKFVVLSTDRYDTGFSTEPKRKKEEKRRTLPATTDGKV